MVENGKGEKEGEVDSQDEMPDEVESQPARPARTALPIGTIDEDSACMFDVLHRIVESEGS